ncbi:MAG: D-2-hydroxyacid dehydrogenase [Micrococcales bacterium]|nr:D-2-hydroxyacid dehydrogenase [Micrococcales bacterium]
MGSTDSVRVVIATPLRQELIQRIAAVDPRVEVVVDHELLPAMRYPADHLGDPDFRRSPEQQQRFEEMLASADVIYGIPGVDPEQLAAAVRANRGLKWLTTMAAGGGAAVAAAALTAEELDRVTFTTSAGVHGLPLAEWAVFGIMAGAKELPRLLADRASHSWSERVVSRPIAGSTVLVLGLGGIGEQVARLCRALGMRVLGVSRSAAPVAGVEVHKVADLAHIVGEADHIVVTLPGTAHTEGMVGQDLLAAVKPGVTIVNVGRGTVIDEPALTAALQDGRVGFAALDVVAVEPLPADSPLWDLANVLISPHTAALDVREEERICDQFCGNLRAFLDGEPMINVVDPELGY